MTTFADDFNRADGPLGNGWTAQGFGPVIASQSVTTSLSRHAYRYPFAAGSIQRVRVDSKMQGPGASTACPEVKVNPTNWWRYAWSVRWSGTRWAYTLYKLKGAGGVALASGYHAGTLTEWLTVEIVYDNGSLTGLVGGEVWASAEDDEFASQDGVGFWIQTPSGLLDNFYCDDLSSTAFDAEPEPLVEMAVPESLTFTGTGTAWTPGTPGAPIFTVDKGTIDSQTVDTATTARAEYTPPQASDTATFTDPSTGLSDAVALSMGFQVDQGWTPSQAVQDWLENTAAQNSNEPGVGLSTLTPVTPYGTGISLDLVNARLYAWVNNIAGDVPLAPPTRSLLDTIWWILNGHSAVDEDHNVFDYANTAAVESTNAVLSLSAIRTDSLLTLQSILDAMPADMTAALAAIQADLDAIRTPFQYTLSTVKGWLDAISSSYLTWILTSVQYTQAVRTPFDWTLGNVKAWIEAIQTAYGYDLGDVKAWIDALPETDLTAVLAAIAAVRGADNVDLTQLHDQTGQLSIDMVALAAQIRGAIAGVRGADAHDLTEVYHAILALPQTQVSLTPVLTAISNLSTQLTNTRSDILAAIDALRPADYPIWPGEANVTLGAPVQFTGDLRLSGPMDGVLMTVDTANLAQRAWQVEGKSYWKWTGYLAFESDHGDLEPAQWLGQTPAVFVPKAMLTAACCVVHLSAGVQATVTPWTYTP